MLSGFFMVVIRADDEACILSRIGRILVKCIEDVALKVDCLQILIRFGQWV